MSRKNTGRDRSGGNIRKGAPYRIDDNVAELDAATSFVPRKASRNGALVFGVAVFAFFFVLVLACAQVVAGYVGAASVLLAALVAVLASSSLHIAMSWERVVVLRLGKVNRVAGPGLYATIPILEHATIRVDQRTFATPFDAKRTLTADLVPITVDAVLFWVVWDVEKACVEVEDYFAAVSFLAQTALREAVGRKAVAEVAISRDELDAEIKEDIEKIATAWGVDIIDVKVRDIVIPEELQDVMSLEAQADREFNARMTVAGAEAELAEMLADAAKVYGTPDAAMKLRSMLMQYETVKKSGSSVVTVPTAVSDGFIDGRMSGNE